VRVTWAAIPALALAAGGLSLAPSAMTHASAQGHSMQALWTITRQSASHPNAETRHVCLNVTSERGELWSCAGTLRGVASQVVV